MECPSWTFDIGSSDNLDDLIRHLRNSLSHRRLLFSSDSRELEDVEVRFRDTKNPKGPDDWGATINVAELQRFVLLFSDLLKKMGPRLFVTQVRRIHDRNSSFETRKKSRDLDTRLESQFLNFSEGRGGSPD